MIITIQRSKLKATKTQIATIDLSQSNTDTKMFNSFALGLQFPEWFGANWDAFNDCMLNLCFDVEDILTINVLNCDEYFGSTKVNIGWLLETMLAMVSGEATQDDGTQIDVVFNLCFNEKKVMEKLKAQIEEQLDENLCLSVTN